MRARPRFKQTETVEQRLSNEAVQLALQPPNKRRSEALSVTEGNLDRFLNEAEECIRRIRPTATAGGRLVNFGE